MLGALQKEIPELKIQLKEVPGQEVSNQLRRGEVDVFVGPYDPTEVGGDQVAPLMKLPLCLLVPEDHSVKRASQIWSELKKGPQKELPLITLKDSEMIRRLFDEGLESKKIEWFPDFETSSLEVVEEYVQRGFGIGLGVKIPGISAPSGLRRIPLTGFPQLIVAGIYSGELKPLVKRFLQLGTKSAKKIKD